MMQSIRKSKLTYEPSVGRSIRKSCGYFMLVLFTLIAIRTKTYTGDSLLVIIPGIMMYLPIYYPTIKVWRFLMNYDLLHEIEPQSVTVIYPGADGKINYEELRQATENFRSPVVVRGLFANTTAVKKWSQPGYLAEKLGKYPIPVVQNSAVNGRQSDRKIELFEDAITDVLSDKKSMKYLFFPVKSRGHYPGSEEGVLENLIMDTDNLTRTDLDVANRLWPSFGDYNVHKTYMGGQFIIGRGHKSDKKATGTHWHCECTGNWFVQVVGSKRWFFIDQKYSSWMKPSRVGIGSFGAQHDLVDKAKYLPVKEITVTAGDLLYNPDFAWHRIENGEGLGIGAPLRELNVTYGFQNNFQFSTVTLFNVAWKKVFGSQLPGA